MKFRAIVTSLFLLFVCFGRLTAAEYLQLPGVVHVHSTVSSGLYSVEELVTLAKEMGLEVLVITDHDLAAMEYGFFPFKNLIKKRMEGNSVLKFGPEKYLSTIFQVNQRQKDVVVIPGVRSFPFYYWSGSSTRDNLTACKYHKSLLLIGMMSPEDYRDLPLLHRGFSTRHIKEHLSQSIIFLLSFLMGLYLVFQRGYLKAAGIAVALFSLAFLINYHPFQSSRFDPYHGEQGIAPYQDLIDYVNERAGLTFWTHPESDYSKSGMKPAPVKLMTTRYNESLIESRDYTGFAAIYDDSMTVTAPGKKWDRLLNEYCSGRRSHPVWGIAGADFRGEADGVRLDTFQTIFIAKSKSGLHILDALAKGSVYAKRKGKSGGLTLTNFSVEDAGTGERAVMGADLNVSSYPVIRAKVVSDDQVRQAVTVLLVKGGAILHQFEGETPLAVVFEDKASWSGKSYYRLEVQSRSAGTLLSNPIFADRQILMDAGTDSLPASAESDIGIRPATHQLKTEPPGEDHVTQHLVELADAGTQRQPGAAEPGRPTSLSGLKMATMSVPYSVQVASLPSFEQAQKILPDFQRPDLPVYYVKVNLGDRGIWWRVYVGYFATQKEAMAARETYGLPESIVQSTPYANQVGVYAFEQEIEPTRKKLESMGYAPYVVRKSPQEYHLYVGAFVTLKGAQDLQRELHIKGVASEVVGR